jgi:hypothetical protein
MQELNFINGLCINEKSIIVPNLEVWLSNIKKSILKLLENFIDKLKNFIRVIINKIIIGNFYRKIILNNFN